MGRIEGIIQGFPYIMVRLDQGGIDTVTAPHKVRLLLIIGIYDDGLLDFREPPPEAGEWDTRNFGPMAVMEIIERIQEHYEQQPSLCNGNFTLGKNFSEIFQTITVDNGSEFQDCDGMQKSLRNRKPRTTIYYCHPYSASERGSNENMNRIVRRFFPKGTNFDEMTAPEVAKAETWMNDYPRAILGWRSAGALFAENIPA